MDFVSFFFFCYDIFEFLTEYLYSQFCCFKTLYYASELIYLLANGSLLSSSTILCTFLWKIKFIVGKIFLSDRGKNQTF